MPQCTCLTFGSSILVGYKPENARFFTVFSKSILGLIRCVHVMFCVDFQYHSLSGEELLLMLLDVFPILIDNVICVFVNM